MSELTDYLLAAHCQPQWRGFLLSLFKQLPAALPKEHYQTLLSHIGRDMAAAMPLSPQPSLPALQHAMNQYWQQRDWGQVRLSMAGQHIVIHHVGCPVPAAQGLTDDNSTEALAIVLGAVYSHWFEQQGGDKHARARLISKGDAWLYHYSKEPATAG
ncbi:cellulose biosynthesis protein BcsD [Gallaecimonas sp. GXIMD1310]|uniref:cellulose biosynthesis protein BcsD n=1 Tax=Gallaecimonas sp. GXIMD1310 TaxID=3131926 RepID=UPI0032473DA9